MCAKIVALLTKKNTFLLKYLHAHKVFHNFASTKKQKNYQNLHTKKLTSTIMIKRFLTLFFALLSCITIFGQTEGTTFTSMLEKAQAGNANAMYDVATMFRKGIGTTKDIEKAIYWYKKAYKKENANAELAADDLCSLYLEEYGVEKAALYIQEFFWDDKAIMNTRLGDLYRETLEPQMIFTSDNQERLGKAIEYYEAAYNKGNKKAVKYLPSLFLKLNKKDYVRAKYYYDKGIVGWAPSGNDFKDAQTCPIAEYWQVEKELAPFESQADAIKAQRTPEGQIVRAAPTKKYVYNPTYRMHITHNVIGNNVEEKAIKLPWNSPLHRYPWGISVAFTQKSFAETKGGESKTHGWWKSGGMAGIQAGVRLNPQFDHGFGFNTGLYYEYYYDTSSEYAIPANFGVEGKCKATLQEHDIYIPAHAEYSLHLGKRFRFFAFGGIGVNYVLSASEYFKSNGSSATIDQSVSDAYADAGYSKFGACLEYGGGLSIEGLQVRITKGTGLNNISKNNGSDVKLEKMNVAVSIHF